MRIITISIVILLAVLLSSVIQGEKGHRAQTLSPSEDIAVGNKPGNLAPQLELLDLDGQTIRLTDYRGKIVYVNFWATWCPPCRDEMPDMQRFYEIYRDHAVILGVNLTKAEASIQVVRSFTEKLGITFPILLDEAGDAINAYRVAAYPATFILDDRGVIREVYRGPIRYEDMEHALTQLQPSLN